MKNRTHFTRKNLIFLALLFFLLVIQIFVAVCLDVSGRMMGIIARRFFRQDVLLLLFKYIQQMPGHSNHI